MVVLCQICDKSFANKRSLATHKSRIHSKTMKEDAKQQSDATESENDSEAASNPLGDSDNSSSESKENDTDSGQSSASSSVGSDSDHTTGTENNDLESDTDPDYDLKKRGFRKRKNGPLHGRMNKKVRKNTTVKDKTSEQMIKVLKSLDKRLKSSTNNCKDKKCPLDYLLSYELKHGVFNHIEELLRGHGKDLDTLLTMEEKSLLNAVLETENLSVVHKLLNENGKMVAKIAKLYTDHSKTQRP